jgi:Cdc6-like AAA superfamily ATPase
MLFTVQEGRDVPKQEIIPISTQQIPVYGNMIGYICDQNLQVTNNPVLLSEKMLLHHIIITGSTGGGKTEVAKRIVTEVEKTRKKILVITPEAHLWKNLENVRSLGDNDSDLGDGISVVDCTNVKDFVREASHVIESVIEHYGKMEQTNNLRLLLVVDEAHLFIDQKDFENVLESATRILRKFGVSCVLLSHTYADFNRGIRSNVQTHIALYTNWARDLSFIKAFQADGTVDYSKLLLSMPEGYGIFRSREFLRNQPVPCRFLRPYETLQTSELKQITSEQIDETYQRRIDVLEIVKKNPGISSDDIQKIIERNGADVTDRTIYKDLEWLEDQNLISVSIGERGKRRYIVA